MSGRSTFGRFDTSKNQYLMPTASHTSHPWLAAVAVKKSVLSTPAIGMASR